jgi:hypothetical protein
MSILLVTGIEGARNCADVIAKNLGIEVEVAEGRKMALAALRRAEFSAVVVDETIAECDPAAAEAIWERAGLAIPVQVNFALTGAAGGGGGNRVRAEIDGRGPSAALRACAFGPGGFGFGGRLARGRAATHGG